jgi:hypothetical protein
MANDKDINHWFNLADKGDLPPGFSQWSLRDKNGMTVAHMAAKKGKLPPGFELWDIADNNGRTVAHEAALWGYL